MLSYLTVSSKSTNLFDSLVCDVYCVFVTFPCGVLGQL